MFFKTIKAEVFKRISKGVVDKKHHYKYELQIFEFIKRDKVFYDLESIGYPIDIFG